MIAMWGVIFYSAAILGINVFTIFFLCLSKWWKTFMSISIVAFFVIVSLVLDLSATARFFPEETSAFIQSISVPVLFGLAVSSWTLVGSFIFVQFFRPKSLNGEVTKVDVKIPKM